MAGVTILTATKRCDHYFAEGVVDNHTAFTPHVNAEPQPDLNWGFRATGFIITLDEGATPDPAAYIEFSRHCDLRVDGKILCQDHHLAFDMSDYGSSLWLRGPAGKSVKFRVFAWIKQR